MSKAARQQRILELVNNGHPIWSQDELRRELIRTGYDVTQATLSRDINELGLLKTPEGYALPEDQAARPLGGDDTILLVASNATQARKVAARIREVLA
jgi:transcriptional regulator of arginine metabolism